MKTLQTTESPNRLCGNICPTEVPRVIRLSQGAAARESLNTQGTSNGQKFQTTHKDFSLFVRLWVSKNEIKDAAQSYTMGLCAENVGSDLHKSDSVKCRL